VKIRVRHDNDDRRVLIGARYVVVTPFAGKHVPQWARTHAPQQWEIVQVISFVGELPHLCRVERLQQGAHKRICVTPCSRLSRNISREMQ
jgi:hypothetical protein